MLMFKVGLFNTHFLNIYLSLQKIFHITLDTICAWLTADSRIPKEAQYVDVINFIKASNLYFAVSTNVEISERLIRQFWRSARIIHTKNTIIVSATIDDH